MIPVKAKLKTMLLGSPGVRPRKIRAGLLRGLFFNVDTACKSSRLVGLDEREIAGATCRLAGEVKIAFDIGANDGWYTLFFASRPNIERVYAFEASAQICPALEANFGLNDPALRAKLCLSNKMVGNSTAPEWCRLDDTVADLPGPALFKIDVEGGELDVLKGARNLLSKSGNRLIIETHTADLERDCIAYLTELGYQTSIVKNGWYRLLFPEARSIPHNRWLLATKNA
jgi:precorrin-6B methylase 2